MLTMSAARRRTPSSSLPPPAVTADASDPRELPANDAVGLWSPEQTSANQPPKARSKPPLDATQYLDFVRRVASRMARNLPNHVSLDDLIGAGSVGLLDAMDRYDPAKADRFETFAEFRVKGAILDELRRYDLMARNARLTAKRIARKTHELTARLGRPPNELEMAEGLDMSVDELRKLVARVGQVRVVSLEDMSHSEDGASDRSLQLRSRGVGPEEAASKLELLEHLGEAVDQLPARQQMILEMYYRRDMTLKEIGRQVGVTESRVCQIMGEATRKLRALLQERRRAA